MAPLLGKRADRRPSGAAGPSPVARFVGFTALATMAIAALATVVLLPAYGSLAETQYQLDCLRADVADGENLVAANEKLIASLPDDDVVAKRLARSQSQWLPADEVVVIDPAGDEPPPLVTIQRQPQPAAPAGIVTNLATNLQSSAAKVVMLVLAAGSMLAATILFTPLARAARDSDHIAARSPRR